MLTVPASTETSLDVTWTAVSDGAGGVASYALRYGEAGYTWGAAAASQTLLSAGSVGAPVSFTIGGLTASTEYSLQVASYRVDGSDTIFAAPSDLLTASTDASPGPG